MTGTSDINDLAGTEIVWMTDQLQKRIKDPTKH